MAFKPRLTKPEKGNKYYITKSKGGYSSAIQGSPTDADCNVLANCVGYAYGRFNEIVGAGSCKYLAPTNAELFMQYKGNLQSGMTPRVGACMVWQKGATLSGSDGAGHVAIVEKVISDTEVVTSESGWKASKPFWTQTRKKGTGNWGQASSYKFLGFIYNPSPDCQGTTPSEPAKPATPSKPTEIKASGKAKFLNRSYSAQFKVTAQSGLYIRDDAGQDKRALGLLPLGTKVRCYGYYSTVGGVKWLYVQTTVDGVTYTGFCSEEFLQRQ